MSLNILTSTGRCGICCRNSAADEVRELSNEENKQYGLSELLEKDIDPNPLIQFGRWYEEASNAGFVHPDAFSLATSSDEGSPSVRMLLLKGFDDEGFVFYTNIESRKGGELAENPRAAMCFWWDKLERQVRIEGNIKEVSEEEAKAYFHSRPKGSKIGAWASRQSSVIENREYLDNRFRELEAEFGGGEIPKPPYWNGYLLVPYVIEFWQGRTNRLHDRLRYRRTEYRTWLIERLSP